MRLLDGHRGDAGAPGPAVNSWSRGSPPQTDQGAGDRPRPLCWFADAIAFATAPDIDVFVELIGGEGGPGARRRPRRRSGRANPCVTANKALLAQHGMRLAALAEENGVALAFEASVAGGIPIVKTLREGLAGNCIERVDGILNGTCNYILTRMEAGGAVLRAMPRRGAEARLRRSRSDLRHRRLRHRAQARDPDLARASARRSIRPMQSPSRASRRSPSPTSRPPRSSATGSSCSASRSARPPASSSACIRRWCRNPRRSPRSWA